MRPNIPTRRALLWAGAIAIATLPGCAPQPNLSVHNVRVADADQGGRRVVTFDLSWRDSFHDSIAWNAAWIFLKYQVDDGGWAHATLSDLSNDYAATATFPLTVVPAPDGSGVLVHRSDIGRGPVDVRGLRIAWEAARDAVASNAEPHARVFALDLIHIPNGPFYLGDGEIGNVAGHFRAADRNVPFAVTSEDSIALGGTGLAALGNGNAYGMNTADDFDEERTGTLPAAFPKGVRAFYLMRYELTEQQYADFLNTLAPAQQRARNPARSCTSSSLISLCRPDAPQPGVRRYGLSAVPPFFSLLPAGPAHHLSWLDGAAYADWSGLRPFTELEYEKAARGPRYPEPGAYAWGTTRIHDQRYTIAQQGTADEHVENPGWGIGNAAFVETMGDPTPSCHSCLRGPLPTGVFAGDTADLEEAGRSYYGAFELSGNLIERVVSVGNARGRAFDGRHGNGALSAEGQAAGDEISTWPGAALGPSGWRVGEASGSGMRGGGWSSVESRLRASDRANAGVADTTRGGDFGYRFARTDPLDRLVPTVPDTVADSTTAVR